MPPCAQFVLESSARFFVTTSTSPVLGGLQGEHQAADAAAEDEHVRFRPRSGSRSEDRRLDVRTAAHHSHSTSSTTTRESVAGSGQRTASFARQQQHAVARAREARGAPRPGETSDGRGTPKTLTGSKARLAGIAATASGLPVRRDEVRAPALKAVRSRRGRGPREAMASRRESRRGRQRARLLDELAGRLPRPQPGDDHDAGALQRPQRLAQPGPPGSSGHRPASSVAIEQHDVEVALERPVREAVVHEHESRPGRRGARAGLVALVPAREAAVRAEGPARTAAPRRPRLPPGEASAGRRPRLEPTASACRAR